MRQVQALLLGIAMLLAVAFAAPPIEASALLHVPPIEAAVVTKYISINVTTLRVDEHFVLVGHLCKQPIDKGVRVTVILNNNPKWIPLRGILKYYVVDGPEKNITAALCSNYNDTVKAHQANCTVKRWKSAANSNIYIKGQTGQTSTVSFTVDVEFIPAVGSVTFVKAPVRKLDYPPPYNKPTYLREIITVEGTYSLAYQKAKVITFTFCQTPQTGKTYKVDVTVTAVNGQGSYTLFICNKLPCEVDTGAVIAYNGRQLPSNNARTPTGSWNTLYALVVCWGGIWNPTQGVYIGNFVFNAHIVK